MPLTRNHQFGVCLTAALCCAHLAATTAPVTDLTQLADAGKKIEAAEARQLEKWLHTDATDAQSRAKLLGFYSLRPGEEPHRRHQHVVWMIQNLPRDLFLASAYCRIDADAPAYAPAKALWMQHLADSADDPALLRHAAIFLSLGDDSLAEQLLQHAAGLLPKDPEWPERLAILYERRASRPVEGRAKLAAQALAQRLRACYLSSEARPRFHRFIEAPRDAVRAGDFVQGKKLAQQLILTASAFRDDTNYGAALHVANIVLGRVALHTGDVDTANSFLITAGQVPPSAHLADIGPDMSLASELLRRGQRRMVHDYLDLCARWWPAGSSRLKAWSARVDAGEQPDFGAQELK